MLIFIFCKLYLTMCSDFCNLVQAWDEDSLLVPEDEDFQNCEDEDEDSVL